MSLDLIPRKQGQPYNRFSYSQWNWLTTILDGLELDPTDEPRVISDEHAKRIADALESATATECKPELEWLIPHVEKFRNSGGYEVV